MYDLAGKDTEEISGTATFAGRKGGATLVTVKLEGTNSGEEHPAHIHRNSVAEGGGIAISLNVVDGASGMSMTNVRAFDGTDMEINGGDPVTFEELLDYDGYINVHKSAADLITIIAQGNIGSNVE